MQIISQLRSYKISNNTVVFDYVATLLGAIGIATYTEVPLVIVTVLVFILGEVSHYLLGVKTNTLVYLNL